jgi:UDP-N-acetylmuramoyl-L-alanyl-D-glutamate--2,6-diaminopimelate ligase
MKLLKDLLYKVQIEAVSGPTNCAIAKIEFDSRKVSKNDVFVAIVGTQVDGHNYIQKAIDAGAVAIICQELPLQITEGVTYVQVVDCNEALAYMAANYYDNPSENLKLVGVTGTNGKTTVTSLLYQLFKKAGYKVGLLSTVKVMVDDKVYNATHTTPDSLAINTYLRMMNDAGVEYCFMEASSHGIHQKRTAGLKFEGAIFTNLSHDHLDYHKTFAAYRDAKKQLFDQLPKSAWSLVNTDDKNGLVMLQNTHSKKYTYALKNYADYRVKVLENQFSGLLLKIGEHEVWTKLVGDFNAYNILAIYAASNLLGLSEEDSLRIISELESVSGRFQYLVSDEGVTAVVDYAHTPDALKNVLETINAIRTKNESLITVVGCGGDRDAEKRPKMGQIAAALSSQVIFTSDNPRSEDPQTIIDQMEAGVEPQDYKKLLSIVDRKQAIRAACKMAQPNDIILIAGKGHEDYQEINGVRSHFDDFELVGVFLNELKNKKE